MKNFLFAFIFFGINILTYTQAVLPNVPIGCVVAFAGDKSHLKDENWKICDGQTLNARNFKELFYTINTSWGNGDGTNGSFNLPDLRGMFLRGVDDSNSKKDPDSDSRIALNEGGHTGNQVGSYQSDVVGTHSHSGARRGSDKPTGSDEDHLRVYLPSFANNVVDIPKSTNFGEGIGSETRPKNVYVYYIIRVK